MSKEGASNRRNQVLIALIVLAGILIPIYCSTSDTTMDKNKTEQETWGPDSRNVR